MEVRRTDAALDEVSFIDKFMHIYKEICFYVHTHTHTYNARSGQGHVYQHKFHQNVNKALRGCSISKLISGLQ